MNGKKRVICMGIMSFFLLSNCGSNTTIKNFCSLSPQRLAGEQRIVEGFLEFACPEFLGAQYPEDCLIFLYDESGCHIQLYFQEGSEALRAEIENDYPLEAFECIKRKIRINVLEETHPEEGTTFYRYYVQDLLQDP